MTLNTILLQSTGEQNPLGSFLILAIAGGVGYYVWNEQQKKIAAAYAEYQEALSGTDKKLALAKGRYYVSLLPKKSQLLKETEIQNDLHGMDSAVK